MRSSSSPNSCGPCSDDLKNAGRIDGLSEYSIFFRLVLPLVRPAMATVAVFTMIPIWNDLWFPLILAPSDADQDRDARQPGVHWPVRHQLERRARGADAGDRAGPRSLPRLLAAARSAASLRERSNDGCKRQCGFLWRGSAIWGAAMRLPTTSNPGFEIVGLVNRSDCASAGRTAAPTRSIRRSNEALAELKPELVSINTYSDSHADYADSGHGSRR